MSRRSRVIVAAALVACGGREIADAGPLNAIDANAAEAADMSFPDASYEASVSIDAVAPPTVACIDGDAGPACPLPPSICADSQRLEYFDNGTCVDGTCHYDVSVLACSFMCADGGCMHRPTTPNAP